MKYRLDSQLKKTLEKSSISPDLVLAVTAHPVRVEKISRNGHEVSLFIGEKLTVAVDEERKLILGATVQ